MKHLPKIATGLLCLVLVATATAANAPDWLTSPRASVMINGGAMMRGDHFSDDTLPAMREHFAGCKRIALVLHATHPDDRDRMEKRLQAAFADLGADVTATSLHNYTDKAASKFLREADGIYVGGGETFALLAELYRTGQLDIIRRRVVKDGVPYFGVSAGSNITGLVVGTTNDFPVSDIPSRNALALIPASINPHHPDAAQEAEFNGRIGKIHGYQRFNPGQPVLALGNNAMIRLHAGVTTVEVEPVWLYLDGKPTEYKKGQPVAFPGAIVAAATATPPPVPAPAPLVASGSPPPEPAITPPPAPAATQPAKPAPPTVTEKSAPPSAASEADKKSIWERLGLANSNEPSWKDIPPLEARVVAWKTANSFVLDNGQIWEGVETIPYELKGKNISIAARPMGAFALSVEGKNTTVRVRRLK